MTFTTIQKTQSNLNVNTAQSAVDQKTVFAAAVNGANAMAQTVQAQTAVAPTPPEPTPDPTPEQKAHDIIQTYINYAQFLSQEDFAFIRLNASNADILALAKYILTTHVDDEEQDADYIKKIGSDRLNSIPEFNEFMAYRKQIMELYYQNGIKTIAQEQELYTYGTNTAAANYVLKMCRSGKLPVPLDDKTPKNKVYLEQLFRSWIVKQHYILLLKEEGVIKNGTYDAEVPGLKLLLKNIASDYVNALDFARVLGRPLNLALPHEAELLKIIASTEYSLTEYLKMSNNHLLQNNFHMRDYHKEVIGTVILPQLLKDKLLVTENPDGTQTVSMKPGAEITAEDVARGRAYADQIFENMTPEQFKALDEHWHKVTGAGKIPIEHFPLTAAEWHKNFPEKFVANNGVVMFETATSNELVEKSKVFGTCVGNGGYARSCASSDQGMYGTKHMFFTYDAQGAITSSFEITLIPRSEKAQHSRAQYAPVDVAGTDYAMMISSGEHVGVKNYPPPPETIAAVREFFAAAQRGDVPVTIQYLVDRFTQLGKITPEGTPKTRMNLPKEVRKLLEDQIGAVPDAAWMQKMQPLIEKHFCAVTGGADAIFHKVTQNGRELWLTYDPKTQKWFDNNNGQSWQFTPAQIEAMAITSTSADGRTATLQNGQILQRSKDGRSWLRSENGRNIPMTYTDFMHACVTETKTVEILNYYSLLRGKGRRIFEKKTAPNAQEQMVLSVNNKKLISANDNPPFEFEHEPNRPLPKVKPAAKVTIPADSAAPASSPLVPTQLALPKTRRSILEAKLNAALGGGAHAEVPMRR